MKKTLLLLSGLLLSGFASQAQWTLQPFTFTPSTQSPFYLSAVDANTAWSAGFDLASPGGGTQVARTFNGGTNWALASITNLAAGESITGIAGLSATTAVVCVANDAGGGRILRTANAGATWTVQSSASQYTNAASFPNYVAFFNATEGVCVGDPINGRSEIYTTADGGITWTAPAAANIPTSPSTEYSVVRRYAVFGNSFWFSTVTGRVFYSSDKGQTWAVASTGITTSVGNGAYLSFRDASNGIAVLPGATAAAANRMARTTNGGATWQTVTYTGPLHNGGIDNVPGTNQFVSVGYTSSDAGSSYSRDNGTTWTAIESTRYFSSVDAVSPTSVWAGATTANGTAGQGVYKLTSTVLGTSKDAALQRGLSVYPNPSANGQFKVEMTAGRGAEAQVTVSDALGRAVYERTVRTAASPAFALDLGRAKAGVYTLQIRTEGGVAQQKIVVE